MYEELRVSRKAPGRGGMMRKTIHVTPPPESFFANYREADRDAARRFYKKPLSLYGLHIGAAATVRDFGKIPTQRPILVSTGGKLRRATLTATGSITGTMGRLAPASSSKNTTEQLQKYDPDGYYLAVLPITQRMDLLLRRHRWR